MIKKITILLFFSLLLAACQPKISEPYYKDGAWYWPGHEDQLQHIDRYYFIDAHGKVKKRASAGSVAPYPFPKEPDAEEKRIYGVAQSEWDSFSQQQQDEIKRDYIQSSKEAPSSAAST